MSDAPMVERRARIFRFGHFPEKRWGVTREEFVAANGESGTVPIGLDPIGRRHYIGRESVLDGLTGEAAFTVEGEEVYATLRMPPLILEAADRAGLKVSSVLHPARKTLTKIDLVDTPYFPDMVIFAREHDLVVVFEGEEPEPVEFCGGGSGMHEAYQSRLVLASHGRPALCGGKVGFARAEKETDDDRLLRQMHHHAVHEGAYCPGMPDGIHHEEVGMSEDNEDVDVEGTTEDEVTFSEEDVQRMTPWERAMYRRMEKLRGEMEAHRSQSTRKDAVAFAAEVTSGKARRAYPGERVAIEEGYARAAAVDAKYPEAVTFTAEDGKPHQGSHVDAFRALILARPVLSVGDPKAAPQPNAVAFTSLPAEPEVAGADDAKELEALYESTRKWGSGLNARK